MLVVPRSCDSELHMHVVQVDWKLTLSIFMQRFWDFQNAKVNQLYSLKMFRFLHSWEHRLQAHREWGEGPRRVGCSCLTTSWLDFSCHLSPVIMAPDFQGAQLEQRLKNVQKPVFSLCFYSLLTTSVVPSLPLPSPHPPLYLPIIPKFMSFLRESIYNYL